MERTHSLDSCSLTGLGETIFDATAQNVDFGAYDLRGGLVGRKIAIAGLAIGVDEANEVVEGRHAWSLNDFYVVMMERRGRRRGKRYYMTAGRPDESNTELPHDRQ